MAITREDGRRPDQIRTIEVERNFAGHAAGSALIRSGRTKILCTATVDENVPPFLVNSGRGWVTAEYSMLPGSTVTRKSRDERRGRVDGRTFEIQRLIGRSMRAGVNLKRLGERTIWLDCDVIEADGGTRTVAITGAFIAMADAIRHLVRTGLLASDDLLTPVAAVSAGVVKGVPLLDLNYVEDSRADVDMNIVMDAEGRFIEIQGSAEGRPFEREAFEQLLGMAEKGIAEIVEVQRRALEDGDT